MTSRSGLPSKTETEVLLSSRRRCAICFGLNRDASVKQGQIAHLDRDRSNNKIENLAFLCLDHHDQYDSRMSQSKGLKSTEVKYYRAELEEALRFALTAPIELHEDQIVTKEWEGIFRWETADASAELQIFKSTKGTPDCYSVSGIAFWGTQKLNGPHTGDFDAEAMLKGDRLVLKTQDYELSMMLIGSGLSAQETCGCDLFGMNVTFEGQYRRVPTGGEALPQPTMRPFESEFWPEEGIPVFEARAFSAIMKMALANATARRRWQKRIRTICAANSSRRISRAKEAWRCWRGVSTSAWAGPGRCRRRIDVAAVGRARRQVREDRAANLRWRFVGRWANGSQNSPI